MSFRILLRNLIVVVVFGISATFAYAQDADDDSPIIVCNTCDSAHDAVVAAAAAGLSQGETMAVVNSTNGMSWIVSRTFYNNIYAQQDSGPGIGTVLVGFPGTNGSFDSWNDALTNDPSGPSNSWECVTPWSMYCW